MKKNWTHKELDQRIDEILKRYKFPLEITVCFKNAELGTLKIDFEYKKEKISLDRKIERPDYLQGSLFDLKGLSSFFKENIESELKLREKYTDDWTKSSALLEILAMSCPWKLKKIFKKDNLRFRTNLGRTIYAKEGGLFELIKNEGPRILCNPDAYEMLTKLISDKEKAGLKINRLRDSLLEYAYNKPIENIPAFPMGRPEADIAQQVGEKGIDNSYTLLRYLFRDIKVHFKSQQISDINEIFLKKGREIIKLLSEVAKKEFPTHNMTKIWDVFLLHNPFYFILQFINKDKDLKQKFLKFDWEPNELAKKILAKLLDISVSKLVKCLYSPKDKA